MTWLSDDAAIVTATPAAAVFDPTELLAACEGDRDIAAAMIDVFRADAPLLLDSVRQAVTHGDAAATCEAAHALKGAVANFGDAASRDAAFVLEQMGRAGDLTGARDELRALEAALARLDQGLARYISDQGAA
jgi:HPt (histidine-containing phosphotransfer) domain-containing protein